MSVEKQKNSIDQQPQSVIGLGSFIKGKWFCECHIAARCLTANKNGTNQGKKFWRCANAENRQCSFFLWVLHEAAAKEWLKISQPEPNFQTPRKTPAQSDDKSRPLIETPTKTIGNEPDSLEIETPFTKAKRRKVTIDATKSDRDNDPFRTAGAQETPSSKPLQVPLFSTSAQCFAEKLKFGTDPLPTSDPEHKPAASNANSTEQLADISGTSSTSARSKNLAGFGLEMESSLASTVLELIRSDKVDLKPSTEIQIRHEIDLVVDLGNTKVQRYQETISKLHERVDELEQIVLHLTE